MNERSLFIAALEIDDPAKRSAFLDESCGDNAELRQRVEKLLRAHEAVGGFLDQPFGAAASPDGPTAAIAPLEQAGARIGPYKLLQPIGEGGMGAVWMAEQTEPVRRMVALKIIKPGLDSSQVIARFEAERQALAIMDHPHIAKVLDAGTTDAGRPFFVMELVKGVPITQYCDEQRLAPAERLALFVPVCQAIQHAHQKGIIHRDIKPSNVLVAAYDGRPVPKVIDFGVAKAMGQKLTERTLFTGFGGIVGTLEYMSPEQAEFNALDVDTRSDIYSLGVLLYELLTGTTPLTKERLKQAAITELLRLIREEEPPPPSTRLSESGASLAAISAQRKSDAQHLPKQVRGELDWIVMKALEKNRTRRYETANGLARDIERFLHDEPVEACAPSAAYRLRKFVRRNRGPVLSAGLVALTLIVGASLATWQAIRAWQAERVAKEAAAVAIKEKDRADAGEKVARRYLYAAHMNLAHEAWKSGNVLRAVELLNQHQPAAESDDLRSFEWRYLWQQTHLQRKTISVAADAERAVMFAFSPNGRWLAVGHIGAAFKQRGDDFTLSKLKLWDLTTGTIRTTIADSGDDPNNFGVDKMYAELVFSADGRLFATIEFDNPMIWHGDENSRYGSRELRAPRIAIWDLATLTRRNSIPLPGFDTGDRVVFSPDSQRIAATFISKIKPEEDVVGRFVVAWDIPGGPDVDGPAVGKELISRQVPVEPLYEFLHSFEFTPDSQSLVWRGGRSAESTVVSVAGKEPDRTLPVNFHKLTFSPDGKLLAGCPYVWDNDTVRSGGWRLVRLCDATTGKTIHDFPVTPMDNMYEPHACFSSDSRTLAVRRGATLQVCDVETKQQIGDLRGHTDNIRAVGFGADGTILTASKDKQSGETQVKIWDIHTRPGPREISLGKGPKHQSRGFPYEREHNVISGMDVMPDGQTLFTTWNSLPAGPETRVVTLTDLSDSVGFRSAKALPFAERKATIDAPPAEPISNWLPERAAFSLDGRRMALSGRHAVQLWQLARGDGGAFEATFDREFPAPQYDSNRSPAAAFSPDGTKLVYVAQHIDGGSRQSDRLWLHDLAAKSETEFPSNPETWFAHQAGLTGYHGGSHWNGSCNGCLFSSDGRRIYSVHKRYVLPWETFIVVWDAATQQVLSVLESPRSLSYVWKPLSLSPDDRLLATIQDDHSIFLWDVSESELRRVHDELARRAAEKKKNNDFKPTDAAAKPRVVMRGHSDWITAVTFHPDGKTLASAGSDRTIKLWDVVTGELRLTLEGHNANIIALSFAPDGHTVISADNSGEVKLWRATH